MYQSVRDMRPEMYQSAERQVMRPETYQSVRDMRPETYRSVERHEGGEDWLFLHHDADLLVEQ